MSTQRLEIAVGSFLLMGFACALALAFASTDARLGVGGDTYELKARFANLGELKVRAPVKIAGVKVGEVAGITLDPQRFDALVTLRMRRDAGELPADTSASIYTAGLLGERYVNLSPGGDVETLAAGDEIALTQSAVVIEQLIGKYMFGGTGAKAPGAGEAPPAAPQTTE